MSYAHRITRVPVRRLFATGAVLALAGCLASTSGLTVDETHGPDAGNDASEPAPITDADVGPVVTDAGADASDGCVPNVSTRAAPDIAPLVNLDLTGTAAVDGTTVLLTPQAQNQAGALWSAASSSFTHFDLTAGFRIAIPTGGGADGMAFVFVNQSTVPDIGADGALLGIDNLPGYGIVIDEFGENYPVSAPLVALVDLTKSAPEAWSIAAQTIKTPVLDDKEHFLRVTFDLGVVTVHIDDELELDHAVIPGYAPFTGRWGFGAGTGGAIAEHRLTRLSFVDPSTNCQ